MKKKIVAMIVAGAIIASMIPALSAYADETETSVPEAPDYSREECWYQIPEITKDVDTFYIYATEYINSSYDEGAPDYASLDNPEMLEKVPGEYMGHASTFADSTNVFVPYYRQAGLRYAEEVWKETGSVDEAFSGMPYEDITAAIDYYFENYNNGRPFIIASHSQGSCIAQYVLANYFKEHPELMERMVDNVVVLPNSISINPLNWKLDDTYAPASENLGSLVVNEETGEPEIRDIGADAQLVLDRGVVLSNAEFDFDAVPEFLKKIFGPESFHGNDYTFFYNNIKENVAKRVAAYLANQ